MWEKLKEIKKWVVEKVLWAETELKGKTGAEKRAAVVAKLNDVIDLPWVPEWVEGKLIGWLVDFVCDMLNRLTGHKFEGVTLDREHTEKLAEVLDAPVSMVASVAAKTELTVDQRIDELYQKYGIKGEEQPLSPPAPLPPKGGKGETPSDEQLTAHFAKSEFACKCGCGARDMDPQLVQMCETIRVEMGMPVRVNSGRRCEKRNAKVGGKPKKKDGTGGSFHMYGKAVDLSCAAGPRKLFETVKRLYEAGKLPGLEYCKEYEWGVHIDIGKKRNQRFAGRSA